MPYIATFRQVRRPRRGIPEYFLYDRARNQLFAHRLPSPGATTYSSIVPQHGRYESRVLGLEVEVAQDRLRFFAGTAMLLESDELIVRLEQMLDQVQQRAEDEARRREEAEREVARLREELERLKR